MGLVQADMEAARQWLKHHAQPGEPSPAG
jgi:hypothetical protein